MHVVSTSFFLAIMNGDVMRLPKNNKEADIAYLLLPTYYLLHAQRILGMNYCRALESSLRPTGEAQWIQLFEQYMTQSGENMS